MKRCKSGHDYDGLACATCLTGKSTIAQLQIAEDLLRARSHPPRTDGTHYSLSRDDWRLLFDQYGWSAVDAQVPTLCGGTMPLKDLDLKRKADECKCVACNRRLRELVAA